MNIIANIFDKYYVFANNTATIFKLLTFFASAFLVSAFFPLITPIAFGTALLAGAAMTVRAIRKDNKADKETVKLKNDIKFLKESIKKLKGKSEEYAKKDLDYNHKIAQAREYILKLNQHIERLVILKATSLKYMKANKSMNNVIEFALSIEEKIKGKIAQCITVLNDPAVSVEEKLNELDNLKHFMRDDLEAESKLNELFEAANKEEQQYRDKKKGTNHTLASLSNASLSTQTESAVSMSPEKSAKKTEKTEASPQTDKTLATKPSKAKSIGVFAKVAVLTSALALAAIAIISSFIITTPLFILTSPLAAMAGLTIGPILITSATTVFVSIIIGAVTGLFYHKYRQPKEIERKSLVENKAALEHECQKLTESNKASNTLLKQKQNTLSEIQSHTISLIAKIKHGMQKFNKRFNVLCEKKQTLSMKQEQEILKVAHESDHKELINELQAGEPGVQALQEAQAKLPSAKLKQLETEQQAKNDVPEILDKFHIA